MSRANGVAPDSSVAACQCRRPGPLVAAIAVCLILLSGCAGQRQHFQALEAGATVVDEPRNSLLLMPLRVWPLQSNLRLSGMHLQDVSNGKQHQLVFYEDESLGSRAVPERKLEYEIAQTAVVDLPPGNYRLLAVDVAFLWQKSSAGIATVEIERELVLPVGVVPGYAGRLTVEVDELTVSDDFGSRRYEFPLIEPVRLYSIDLELQVQARVRIEDSFEQDRADAILAFPGLETTKFVKTLFR